MYSTSFGVSFREMPIKTHKPLPIELTISLLTENGKKITSLANENNKRINDNCHINIMLPANEKKMYNVTDKSFYAMHKVLYDFPKIVH